MWGWEELKIVDARGRSSDKEKEKKGRIIGKPLDAMGSDRMRSKKRELKTV